MRTPGLQTASSLPARVRTSTAYPTLSDSGTKASFMPPSTASGVRTWSLVPDFDAQEICVLSSQPSFHLCQPIRSLLAPQSSLMMSQCPTVFPPSEV